LAVFVPSRQKIISKNLKITHFKTGWRHYGCTKC
jgi:hypothetical protein